MSSVLSFQAADTVSPAVKADLPYVRKVLSPMKKENCRMVVKNYTTKVKMSIITSVYPAL